MYMYCQEHLFNDVKITAKLNSLTEGDDTL